MRHLAARQIKDGPHAGKWHYTSGGSKGAHPIGYCGPYKPCPTCGGTAHADGEPCPDCRAPGMKFSTGVVRKEPHEQCPGHDTPEEACEHYKRYLIEQRTREMNVSDWTGCKVCDAPTKTVYMVGEYRLYALCDEHRTLDQLEELVEVSESWQS